jgi:hypothetical protein
MDKNDYEQIVEPVYLKDGTSRKIGFRAGKWIAETKYDRVAVAKNGYLLYFRYSENEQAHSYQLFCNFAEMAIENNDVDFLLLGQVAAAIGGNRRQLRLIYGLRKRGETEMSDYSVYQLKTIILLNHLNDLNAIWEDKVVTCRIYELDEEHLKNQEYQQLTAEYSQLFNRIRDTDDQKQRNEALFEFDSLIGRMLVKTQKFHYLAGFNDAMPVINVS